MAQPLAGNIENMIGYTKVPLGQAGPIKIFHDQFSTFKEYNLPLSTTEGALVASVNRGCKATRLSGGIKVMAETAGATRAPVFKVKNLAEGRQLIDWVQANFCLLQNVAESTSAHLKLVDFKPQLLGKNVWFRFRFDTGEAMGMNMATIAAEAIAKLIKQKLNLDCLALSGNFCVDKKAGWLNFTEGRGKKVWAEAVVKRETVKEVLKTTPEKIVEVVQKKQWLGSIVSGSIGANGHFANIAAALFLATGQDMAHVVEASLGVTTAELENKDLYFSVYLPDLMVGTIGGGTRLATQQEALKMLGSPNASELAGIIGGAVLAGELSLTAALASGDLAKAHRKLGRARAQ